MKYNRFARTMLGLALACFATGGCQNDQIYHEGLLPGRTLSAKRVEAQIHQVVQQGLESRDPASRCHALESLALLGGGPAKKQIRNHLYDNSPAVRVAAALAVGDIQDQTAKNALHILLREKYVSVQLAAAYALERLGDKRFVQWYDNVLMGDDPKLSGLACMLLGKLGETELRQNSREKLWAVLKKPDQKSMVRLQAAEALARLGDVSVLERLLAYAGSTFADDRMLALSGLAELDKQGNADAFAALTVLAGDSQLEVRLAAYAALGDRNDKHNLQETRDSLTWQASGNDEIATARVRGLALITLGKIGNEEDLLLIYDAMSSPMLYVRLSAAHGAIHFIQRQQQTSRLQGI